MTSNQRLIVGLGNPDKQYEHTRHNAGWIILDALAQELNATNFTLAKKFSAQVSEARAAEKKIILIKPQTFMNNSGVSVRAALDYFKILPKKLGLFTVKDADLSSLVVIIHDDIDLPLGSFKIQTNRGSAGHRGVASIISHLKTQNFTRVRVGISSERKKNRPVDKFVLEKLSSAELTKLKKITPDIIRSVLDII